MTSRRVVGLTLAGVLLLAIIMATVGFGVVARHREHQARHRESQASDRANALQADIRALNQQLGAQYDLGYAAGKKDERQSQKATESLNKQLGLTYGGGYKEGYQAAFAGFGGWTDGSWYAIKIGTAKYGYQIETRVPLAPCELTYLLNDAIYTRGAAC